MASRFVIKLGTGLLTEPGGAGLDLRQFRRLTREIAGLVADGHQCVVVSSGAVGAGLMALGLAERPTELARIQACAAIGQSRLMRLYGALFARRGLLVAQVLLTHSDLDSRICYGNARNTLEELLGSGRVVPIINENDTVAVEELRFGDNDRLSAEVACLVRANLLIVLTSANGLTRDGRPDSEPIPEVEDVASVMQFASGSTGRFSVGGMGSKLQAVKLAVDAGIPAVIAHGRTPGLLGRIAAGEAVGTHFSAKR
ncbi:MAG: glutamate 5-kinase [Verrucomicrobia bacterium]|nr:glutamate 5-kinase [Verrucomicrobiota bacterium]